MIEIHNFEQALPDCFFTITAKVYENYPWYTPESAPYIKTLFSAQHGFYGAGQSWVGIVPEQARLAGFVHPGYDSGTAYFGYWETVNDLPVNRQLFQALEKWAVARGATRIKGPINFNTFGPYRLQISHFNQPAFFTEPSNPDYYVELGGQLGYTLCNRYATLYVPRKNAVGDEYNPLFERLQRRLTIAPLTGELWLANSEAFFDFIVKTFGGKTAFSAISWQEFRSLYADNYARKLCPESSFYMSGKRGEIIGLGLVVPHYGELTRQGGAQVIADEDIDYRQHFPQLTVKTPVFKVIGVSPEHKDMSLTYVLMVQVLQSVKQHYNSELLQVGVLSEESRRLLFVALGGNVVDEKTYGLFAKSISGELADNN